MFFGSKKKELEKKLREARNQFESAWGQLRTNYNTELANRWLEAGKQMRIYLDNPNLAAEDKLNSLKGINAQLNIQLDTQKYGQQADLSSIRFLIAYIEEMTNTVADDKAKLFHKLYEGMMAGEYPAVSTSEQMAQLFAALQKFRQRTAEEMSREEQEKLRGLIERIDRALRRERNFASILNQVEEAIDGMRSSGDVAAADIYKVSIRDLEEFLQKKEDILSNLSAYAGLLESKIDALDKAMEETELKCDVAVERGQNELKARLEKEFQKYYMEQKNLKRSLDAVRKNEKDLMRLLNTIEYLKDAGIGFDAFKAYFAKTTVGELLNEKYDLIMTVLTEKANKPTSNFDWDAEDHKTSVGSTSIDPEVESEMERRRAARMKAKQFEADLKKNETTNRTDVK